MRLIQTRKKASTNQSKKPKKVQYIQASKAKIINKPSGHLSPKADSRERLEKVREMNDRISAS